MSESAAEPGPAGEPTTVPATAVPSAEGNPALQIPFRTIFWTVVSFTAGFWLAFLILTLAGPHTEEAKTAVETVKNAGISGIGTIFGLAGEH